MASSETEEAMEQLFMSHREFIELLENLANEVGSYIDAVVVFSEENEMEIDDIVSLLSKSYRQKIKQEASSLNLLKEKQTHTDISQFFGE